MCQDQMLHTGLLRHAPYLGALRVVGKKRLRIGDDVSKSVCTYLLMHKQVDTSR